MKNLILSFFAVTAFCLNVYGQEIYNMELIAEVQMEPLTSANDVWGYVDKEGIEYAIVGTQDDTRIYSLENPAAPDLILRIPGTNTIWRDMKSHGDYVYSVTDRTSDGLTIIDMSSPKDSIPHSIYYPKMEIAGQLDSIVNAHNLYIDENGILYTCGGNLLDGAPIFLDLNIDPKEPPVIGWVDGNEYAHDIYVRGDTLYASEIYKGEFSIYDISDKMNSIYMAGAQTSFEFTHNVWLSDDGRYVFTTDEKPNAFVDAYDISDLNNIVRLNSIRPDASGGSILPHNTHFINNYLVTSWYGEGIIITDVSDPSNMVIVGQYDTNPQMSGGSRGSWGAYPYLPSGMILGSDRDNGLFVLQPDYQRAAYLEGCITNSITGEGINGVELTFIDLDIGSTTGFGGEIKTGVGTTGSYEVYLYKDGFAPMTVTVEMVQGEITILKQALLPAQERSINIRVVDAESGDSIPDAQIYINSPGRFIVNTDSSGTYKALIIDGIYEIYVGAWGYYHEVAMDTIISADDVVIELERGYQDDYFFDFEWTTSTSSNVAGSEVVSDFTGDEDVGYDLGEKAYELYALDTSVVTLTSQIMDLTIYEEPRIELAVNKIQNATALKLYLVTPTQEVLLTETIGASRWEFFPLPIDGLLDSYEEVYFRFEGSGSDNTSFMAQVDAFIVVEGKISSTEEPSVATFKLFPNPASEMVHITASHDAEMDLVTVYDIQGRQVFGQSVSGSMVSCDLSEIKSGLYFLTIGYEGKIVAEKKIIVR